MKKDYFCLVVEYSKEETEWSWVIYAYAPDKESILEYYKDALKYHSKDCVVITEGFSHLKDFLEVKDK